MRLVCPNCDAQYEVDDAAIPLDGRDVQCSNCGHAWFQAHPAALPEEAEPELAAEAEPTPVDPEPVAPPLPPVDVASDPASPAAVEEQSAPPRRRALDENVLAVLREEAEREAAVRRVEAPPRPVEVQADLGLMAPPPLGVPPSVLAAREKFADLSADPAEIAAEEEDAAQRPASRRELLPDIEEINSTLRAGSEPRGDDSDLPTEVEAADRRRGFRTGFVLMIVLAVLVWSAYVMAPRIVAQIPASEAAMAGFVSAVDRARVEVDAALQSASRSLRSLSGVDG